MKVLYQTSQKKGNILKKLLLQLLYSKSFQSIQYRSKYSRLVAIRVPFVALGGGVLD